MSPRATWTPEQVALVRKLAGRHPAAVIARRVSAIGPQHTATAVASWADRRGIHLRLARRPFHGGTAWLEEEKAIIKAQAGRRPVAEITEEINARFGRDRSVAATRRRAQLLGIWMTRYDGMGLDVLRATLGMRERRIHREVEAGRLRVERRGNGHAGSFWLFRPADVEAWINAYPWALDWRRVRRERWRNLARAASLRDPHVSIAEVAGLLGVRPHTIQSWVRKGWIDGVKDIGPSGKPIYRIPTRELDRIEQLAGKRKEVAA